MSPSNGDRPSQGKVRPSMGNVIYANFGNKTRVSEVPKQVGRARSGQVARSAAGRMIVLAAETQADTGRVSRGQAYARNGNVVSLTIANGRITGEVAGSQNQPFQVAAALPRRSADELTELTQALAQSPVGLIQAKEGDLAEEALGILLANQSEAIRFSCDCPDPAPVCKHAVALAHQAAARFDANPAEIFALRGLNLDQVERSIREDVQSRVVSESQSSNDRFWGGLELPALPDPKVAPALEDSNEDLLHKALRTVSYTTIDELRAKADLEEMYDVLTGRY